jgi:hypothetical protein
MDSWVVAGRFPTKFALAATKDPFKMSNKQNDAKVITNEKNTYERERCLYIECELVYSTVMARTYDKFGARRLGH